MKVQCDVCKQAAAVLLCCSDDAALCEGCDTQIHAANKLAGKHERIPLIGQEPSTCDICQEKAGNFFCMEDRALLCRDCDVSIHTANKLASKHKRFLVCGVRVGLEALTVELPPPPLPVVARVGMEALISAPPPLPPARVGLESLIAGPPPPPPPPPAPPPHHASSSAGELVKPANSNATTHNLGMNCLPLLGQFDCPPLLFDLSSSSSSSSADISDCLAQLDQVLNLPIPNTSFTPPPPLMTNPLEEWDLHNQLVGLNVLHASPSLVVDSFAKVPSTPSPSMLQGSKRKIFMDESSCSTYDHPMLVPTSILRPCKQNGNSLYGNAIIHG